MSLWTCEACGGQDRHTNKGNHQRWKCPKQGNMLKKIQKEEAEAAREAAGIPSAKPEPTYWQYLTCLCGCKTRIGQIKGQKKKQFVDAEHYEKWRSPTKVAQAQRERAAEAAEAARKAATAEERAAQREEAEKEQEERLRAEEVAAIAVKDEAIVAMAQATRIVTGAASHALWGACLGVVL